MARSIRLAGTLAIVAVTCVGCGGGSAQPGLYVAKPTGGAAGWIGAPAGIPVWSPTGDVISWGTEDGLLLSSLDGDPPRTISRISVAGKPAWSPDGSSIAFVDRGLAALVVINAESGETQFSTSIANPDAATTPLALVASGGPAWAPDGSRIAFICWDGAGDEACLIENDGTNRRQVTQIEPPRGVGSGSPPRLLPARAHIGTAAWSPDGRALAVASYPERSGEPSGVFVVDLEKGQARRVSSLSPNSEISWYPDGDAVAFSVTQRGRSDVVRVSIVDGRTENLTEALPLGSRDPSISPDGSRLAMASPEGIILLGDKKMVAVSVNAGLRPTHPAWNPAGDAIAFAAESNPLASYN